jgi:hypothetical protein
MLLMLSLLGCTSRSCIPLAEFKGTAHCSWVLVRGLGASQL